MSHIKANKIINIISITTLIIIIFMILTSKIDITINLMTTIFSIAGVCFPITISIISSYNFNENLSLEYVKEKKKRLFLDACKSSILFIILSFITIYINLYKLDITTIINLYIISFNLNIYKLILIFFCFAIIIYTRTFMLLILNKDEIEIKGKETELLLKSQNLLK